MSYVFNNLTTTVKIRLSVISIGLMLWQIICVWQWEQKVQIQLNAWQKLVVKVQITMTLKAAVTALVTQYRPVEH